MTVPATLRKAGPFNGNGSATSFPFSFKVFSDEDIEVVRQETDGTETTLVLDSDYSVTLNGDQDATPGGSVTYPISGAALASGERLSIVGALAYDQETDLPTGGNFNPTVIENALDRLAMQIQQVDERASRAVTIPVTSTTPGDEILAQINEDVLAAAASAASAAATYDAFDDRYLGAKAADPALDNDGNALLTGAMYWSTSLARLRVYSGSAWVDAGVATPMSVNVQRFGTGSQTVFTLTNAPAFENAAEVFISGVRQVPGVDYTVTGAGLTTLTFTSAPVSGTNNIFVQTLSAYAAGVPNDGSVTTAKLADGSVTTAKLGDASVTLAKLTATGTPSSSSYLRGDNTWVSIPVRTGGTTTSSAVDVTLTAASNQFQQISMTAADRYVILPDATTMNEGAAVFVIENKGTYAFGVKNSAGEILLPVVYFLQELTVTLRDNATAAGTWGFGTSTALWGSAGPLNVSALSYSASSVSGASVPLSSTSVLILYQSATNTTSAVVATVSGFSVSFGTPVTVLSSASFFEGPQALVALSSTSAAAFFMQTTGNMNGVALSISGTTITVGTPVASGATGLQYSAFLRDSSTTGVVGYSYSTSSTSGARAFSVSGTTFTWGTGVTLFNYGTNYTGVGLAPLSAGTYMLAVSFDTPAVVHRAFTISGTTITAGGSSTTDTTNYSAIVSRGFNTTTGTAVFGSGASSGGALYLRYVYSGTTFSSVTRGTPAWVGTTAGFSWQQGFFGGLQSKQGFGASTNVISLYSAGFSYTDLSTNSPAVSYGIPFAPGTSALDASVLDTSTALLNLSSGGVVAAQVVKFTG